LATDDETAGVWDEAFFPLATGAWTRGDADNGAVVVGSLTKLFACPGLRLGYVVAPDRTAAARIEARQPAWSVNGLAVAALPDLLAVADLVGWSALVGSWRRALIALLARNDLIAEPVRIAVPDPGGLARLAHALEVR